MSNFKEAAIDTEGIRCWKRDINSMTLVSVVCRTYSDGHEPASEYETFVRLGNYWHLFDDDLREELDGLTEAQLREWCEARTKEAQL